MLVLLVFFSIAWIILGIVFIEEIGEYCRKRLGGEEALKKLGTVRTTILVVFIFGPVGGGIILCICVIMALYKKCLCLILGVKEEEEEKTHVDI